MIISKLENQEIRCFGVIPKNQILETREVVKKWRKREKNVKKNETITKS